MTENKNQPVFRVSIDRNHNKLWVEGRDPFFTFILIGLAAGGSAACALVAHLAGLF